MARQAAPNSHHRQADQHSAKRRKHVWRWVRYGASFLIWLAIIWTPIGLYLTTSPLRFTSQFSLILPGSGVSTSVNLDSIGQASSFASSAFSSNSVSPTQTYKRLIRADRIRAVAAEALGVSVTTIPRASVDLVDQTGLIQVQVTGPSAATARDFAGAILKAFQDELDTLRQGEISARQTSAMTAIEDYQRAVARTRARIDALQRETGFLSVEQFSEQVRECDVLRVQVKDLFAQLQQKQTYVTALETALDLNAEEAAMALTLYADSAYLSLSQDVTQKTTSLSDAEAQFGARHPKRVMAKAQSDQARSELSQLLTQRIGKSSLPALGPELSAESDRSTILADLVRVNAETLGLRAQYAALNARYLAERARLERIAPLAASLEDRNRDFRVSEAVFASAIARGQSSKVDVYGSYPLVQVLEKPSLPLHSSSPRRKIAFAGGGLATLCVFFAGLLGWMRHRLIFWLTKAGDWRGT